jgi:serine/threonine-protein kinase RsbW
MCERATPADLARLWEQPYPGTADQVRCVRAALREFLADCPVADDAVHLLSELSANAIAHSDSGNKGGAFTVRAEHVRGRYVRCEVEDQGSTWDGNLSSSARHPHGLYLLELLASSCGVERIGRVHIVWFCIDYLLPTTAHRGLLQLCAPRASPSHRSIRTTRAHPAMTGVVPGSLADQAGRDDLTPRIFRALYQDFDLLTIGTIHIVIPKGTPVFSGDSLGQIALQISDHEHGTPALPSYSAPLADDLPTRVPLGAGTTQRDTL